VSALLVLAWFAVAVLGGMLVVALWNLVAAPRLHRHAPSAGGVPVSVLVPARDEAWNLERLLPDLVATRYQPMEIVVLDDGSRDATLAVARAAAAADPRVRVLEGLDPPDGWTGKNWACHQLARFATGAILIFCDADVRPGPDAVGRTVAALESYDVGALTAIPRPEPAGWLQDAVIPLVARLPVAALLPLALVPRLGSPALSMGNGQWFAWRESAYRAVGGHCAVRADILEDVRLGRRAKAAAVGLVAVAAPRDLSVRMYRSPGAVREGFGKNLYPLLGGRDRSFGLALALFLLTMVAPVALLLAAPAEPLLAMPAALLLALRLAAARLLGDPIATVALHPVGALVTPFIAVESWRRHRAACVRWKGRVVPVREGA
jgi:chlorobactene glucosyltransferase